MNKKSIVNKRKSKRTSRKTIKSTRKSRKTINNKRKSKRTSRKSTRKSRKSKRVRVSKKKIPKIVHQIWLGGSKPFKLHQMYMNTCKKLYENNDWEYLVWRDKDITRRNFPKTYDYIKRVIAIGTETGSLNKKYAQIADLMRLEILYNHGGMYLDTTVECIDPILLGNDKFVVSNECKLNGFKCRSENGLYVSNSFIASIARHPIIRHMLSKKVLEKIDYFSPEVNLQTGPYFLGKFIHKFKNKYDITMLHYNLVYPHSPEEKCKCIHTKKLKLKPTVMLINKDGKKIFLEYPCKAYKDSYFIKHFEAGGTWL